MDTVPDTFDSLFYGYAAVWVLLAAFLYSLSRRVSTLGKKALDKANDEHPSS